MVVWYFVVNGKREKRRKKNRKKTEKNILKTYTHPPHRRLRKLRDI